MTLSDTSCKISYMNNKAVSLVKEGHSREAIKLFLQALSALKSEVCSQNKAAAAGSRSSCSPTNTPPVGNPYLRVSVGSEEDSSSASSFAMFDKLFAMNPQVDPCAPQQRDGTTACLLYNMALSHQRMSESNAKDSKTCLHLKKAASTFTMSFSAAQHWKRWTKEHAGFNILQLAILNNLMGLHTQLGNATKVQQLQGCFQNALAATPANEMSQDERTFFAANLQRQHQDSSNSSSAPVETSQPALLGEAA